SDETNGGADGARKPVGGRVIDTLCESWAAQLGSEFPELTPLIVQALSDLHRTQPQSASRSFPHQFNSLILQPLRQLQRSKHDLAPQAKILFVLDTVDACSQEERREILRGLKGINASHGIKILLVSELPSTEGLSDIAAELIDTSTSTSSPINPSPSATIILRGSINIHSASNVADILLYLTSRFQQHANTFHSHPQFRPALIEPTIRVLAKRAEGIFLWAKVAFEMLLSADNPTRMLLNLIEEDSLSDLNGLYLECVLEAQTRLNTIQESNKGKQREQGLVYPRNSLAVILSCVAYATEVLSISTLAAMSTLGVDRVLTIVHLLSALLEISGSSPLDMTGPSLLSKRRSEEFRSSSFAKLPAAQASTISIPNMSSPSMPPFQPPRSSSKRPKSANARKTSFSPAAKKRASRPSPKAASSPISGTAPISTAEGHPLYSGLEGPPPWEELQSPAGGFLSPSDASPVTNRQEQYIKGGSSAFDHSLVRVRHSTMRDWICRQHPPTLLSSLMGKGAMEEDDLR
ncbi:hypothetical protein FRC17_008379, partial [Serendipita sp. 399]